MDISPLKPDEYAQWQPLAEAYMTFYKSVRIVEEYEKLWCRLHSECGLYSFGARLNGELVGFTHYLFHASAWSADVCYLQDLFVSPQYRGRGTGRILIERVTQHAKQKGSPRVYWLTQDTNEVARKLYDRVASHSGFIRYERNLR